MPQFVLWLPHICHDLQSVNLPCISRFFYPWAFQAWSASRRFYRSRQDRLHQRRETEAIVFFQSCKWFIQPFRTLDSMCSWSAQCGQSCASHHRSHFLSQIRCTKGRQTCWHAAHLSACCQICRDWSASLEVDSFLLEAPPPFCWLCTDLFSFHWNITN